MFRAIVTVKYIEAPRGIASREKQAIANGFLIETNSLP
jgi:hypothetical protein